MNILQFSSVLVQRDMLNPQMQEYLSANHLPFLFRQIPFLSPSFLAPLLFHLCFFPVPFLLSIQPHLSAITSRIQQLSPDLDMYQYCLV